MGVGLAKGRSNTQGRRMAAAAVAAASRKRPVSAISHAGQTSRAGGAACGKDGHPKPDNVDALPQQPDRAGTPGFRAPEVLLHSMEQGTPVDMWATGVVFLGLLVRRYPVFQNTDRGDEAALLQIAALLGPARVQAAAERCRRTVTEIPSAEDLHTPTSFEELVAPSLRRAAAAYPSERARLDAALELVLMMMDPDPTQRISAAEALERLKLRRRS